MADKTSKILKEFSDMSGNMDILFKELRESTEANKDLSKNIGTLSDKISDNADKKDTATDKSFKTFTASIEKSLSDTEKTLNKTLKSSVSDFIDDLPNRIAGVDKKTPSTKADDDIEKMIQKARKTIPGLKDGGDIKSNGIAIIGEDGPELMEMKKGNSVINNQDLSLQNGQVDEAAKRKKDYNNAIENSLMGVNLSEKDKKLIKEGPGGKKDKTVEEVITSPETLKSNEESAFLEIEKIVSPLRDQFKEYLADIKSDDPDEYNYLMQDMSELKDEFKYFKRGIEADTFTAEDIKKYQDISKKNLGDMQKAKNADLTEASNLTDESSLAQTKEEKEPAKGKDIKPVLNDKFSDIKKSFTSIRDKVKENIEPKKLQEKAKSFLDKKVGILKTQNKPKLQPDVPKAESVVSSTQEESTNKSSIKNTAVNKSSEKKEKKSASVNSASTQTQQINKGDISDIKALLASIYTVLSGPLDISSEEPYRPNTNHF